MTTIKRVSNSFLPHLFPPQPSSCLQKHTNPPFPTVERRRRETINEGINELAKIVPGCEKNKGSILQRAVHYIMDLKRQQDEMMNKQTLEKVVLEQALAEVTNRNEVFKDNMEKAWAENRVLKAKLRTLGVGLNEGEEGEGESAEGESE